MNKGSISISLGLVLTVLLFYYVICIYQSSVPGTSKWLIKGKIAKAVAQAATANQPATTAP